MSPPPDTPNASGVEPHFAPWTTVPVAAVVEALRAVAGPAAAAAGRPAIVAIDGRSASGKSTLADALADATAGGAVVRTDDVAWHHGFFDWDALLAEHVLRPARAGRTVRWRPPAWQERDRDGAIAVPDGCRVLYVEGVGAARRSLAPLLDAVVWVASDAEHAETRGTERDGGDAAAARFWHEWMAEELPFLARERPWERADLVVCGTPEPPIDPATEIAVADRRRDPERS